VQHAIRRTFRRAWGRAEMDPRRTYAILREIERERIVGFISLLRLGF